MSSNNYVGFPVSVIIAGFCVMSLAYLICFCCCIIQFFVRRNRNPGSSTRAITALESGVQKQKNDKLKRQLWRQFQNSLKRFRKNRPSSQVLADPSCVGFCPICFEEYKGDPAEILVGLIKTCGHFFHFDCIWEWLENHRTCPLCRGPAQLRESDIKGLALRHVDAYKDCVSARLSQSLSDEVKKVPSDCDVVEAGTSRLTSSSTSSSQGAETGEEATEESGVVQNGNDAQIPSIERCRSIVVAVDIEDTGDSRRTTATTTKTATMATGEDSGAVTTAVVTPRGRKPNQMDISTDGAQSSQDATPRDVSHDNPAFVVDETT